MPDIYRYNMPFLFYDINPTKETQYKTWTRQKAISINKYYVEYIDGYSGIKHLNMLNLSNLLSLFKNATFIKIKASSGDFAVACSLRPVMLKKAALEKELARYKMFTFDMSQFLQMVINLGRRNILYNVQHNPPSKDVDREAKGSWLSDHGELISSVNKMIHIGYGSLEDTIVVR